MSLEIAQGSPEAIVDISQVRTLSVERIGARVANVTPEELAQVVEGFVEIVG